MGANRKVSNGSVSTVRRVSSKFTTKVKSMIQRFEDLGRRSSNNQPVPVQPSGAIPQVVETPPVQSSPMPIYIPTKAAATVESLPESAIISSPAAWIPKIRFDPIVIIDQASTVEQDVTPNESVTETVVESVRDWLPDLHLGQFEVDFTNFEVTLSASEVKGLTAADAARFRTPVTAILEYQEEEVHPVELSMEEASVEVPVEASVEAHSVELSVEASVEAPVESGNLSDAEFADLLEQLSADLLDLLGDISAGLSAAAPAELSDEQLRIDSSAWEFLAEHDSIVPPLQLSTEASVEGPVEASIESSTSSPYDLTKLVDPFPPPPADVDSDATPRARVLNSIQTDTEDDDPTPRGPTRRADSPVPYLHLGYDDDESPIPDKYRWRPRGESNKENAVPPPPPKGPPPPASDAPLFYGTPPTEILHPRPISTRQQGLMREMANSMR